MERFQRLCVCLGVSADHLFFGGGPACTASSEAPAESESASARARARFRIAVCAAVLVLGAVLAVFALLSSLIETYQPYQEWYPGLGPYATYLFTTWRFGVLALGIGCIAGGAVLLFREYKHL